MSQTTSVSRMLNLLQEISALYRTEAITADERNAMATLAKNGRDDNFNALYQYICERGKANSAIEDMKELFY